MGTPRLLVSPLLVQILHNREVTIGCCPVQWSQAILITRLQIHLRTLLHTLHIVQLSSFTCLHKAMTVGQVLGMVTATLGISQVQLPALRIGVSHEEHQEQGLNGC